MNFIPHARHREPRSGVAIDAQMPRRTSALDCRVGLRPPRNDGGGEGCRGASGAYTSECSSPISHPATGEELRTTSGREGCLVMFRRRSTSRVLMALGASLMLAGCQSISLGSDPAKQDAREQQGPSLAELLEDPNMVPVSEAEVRRYFVGNTAYWERPQEP